MTLLFLVKPKLYQRIKDYSTLTSKIYQQHAEACAAQHKKSKLFGKLFALLHKLRKSYPEIDVNSDLINANCRDGIIVSFNEIVLPSFYWIDKAMYVGDIELNSDVDFDCSKSKFFAKLDKGYVAIDENDVVYSAEQFAKYRKKINNPSHNISE